MKKDYTLTIKPYDYGQQRVVIKYLSYHPDYPNEEWYIYIDWLEKYGIRKCVEKHVERMSCAAKDHLEQYYNGDRGFMCKCHIGSDKANAHIEELIAEIKRKVKIDVKGKE